MKLHTPSVPLAERIPTHCWAIVSTPCFLQVSGNLRALRFGAVGAPRLISAAREGLRHGLPPSTQYRIEALTAYRVLRTAYRESYSRSPGLRGFTSVYGRVYTQPGALLRSRQLLCTGMGLDDMLGNYSLHDERRDRSSHQQLPSVSQMIPPVPQPPPRPTLPPPSSLEMPSLPPIASLLSMGDNRPPQPSEPRISPALPPPPHLSPTSHPRSRQNYSPPLSHPNYPHHSSSSYSPPNPQSHAFSQGSGNYQQYKYAQSLPNTPILMNQRPTTSSTLAVSIPHTPMSVGAASSTYEYERERERERERESYFPPQPQSMGAPVSIPPYARQNSSEYGWPNSRSSQAQKQQSYQQQRRSYPDDPYAGSASGWEPYPITDRRRASFTLGASPGTTIPSYLSMASMGGHGQGVQGQGMESIRERIVQPSHGRTQGYGGGQQPATLQTHQTYPQSTFESRYSTSLQPHPFAPTQSSTAPQPPASQPLPTPPTHRPPQQHQHQHPFTQHPPYSDDPHNTSPRFTCPACSKVFSRPSSLKIHGYSHTGERPFVCTVPGCGRAFSVRSNMRRHMRVHGGEVGGGGGGGGGQGGREVRRAVERYLDEREQR
ncbi:hypothetical protein G7K_2043-t1 [Saitoella complicata NRRL Y-17804]|uniref:C2H2-type domain-containing protein n=3 Tax=Saitoella complicata (strain BCRC 22490 / CBS 7301 / JCM 7358 / NBRC 10748 / NRRL Y-17804) TaxID=698492 RepID=A0A0E9NDB4_SAICN|nr:hypothetical protein G7K_2043-t1 [Saitoella complicata NRRL Y-17804]